MSLDRDRATAFVDGYGRTWENWDTAGFVALFSEAVVYVAHPTETTVVGREALAPYLAEQEAQMGTISVRMGEPIVGDSHVAAEFWVTATNRDGEETTAGCLMAQLDHTDAVRAAARANYWILPQSVSVPPRTASRTSSARNSCPHFRPVRSWSMPCASRSLIAARAVGADTPRTSAARGAET